MISQDSSFAGWGRENLRKKMYLHVTVFDMLLLIPYPAFLAPWHPVTTYWWGSCLYGSCLQRMVLQWDAFPWSCLCLQDTMRRKAHYSASVIENSFSSSFFHHSLFFFLNNCRKYGFDSQCLPLKLGEEKKTAPKHRDFDLQTHQSPLGSRESLIVPGFISADSLSRKVLLQPCTAGSGVVWWQNVALHADAFKVILSYFFLVRSGNLALLFTWALFLLPERECLNASYWKLWK